VLMNASNPVLVVELSDVNTTFRIPLPGELYVFVPPKRSPERLSTSEQDSVSASWHS
jgi:hypothetical protein